MTIGQRIKARREELNMSQEELAIKIGYKSRSSINKIELDLYNLKQSKIKVIADALNVSPAYIMGWEEKKRPEPEVDSDLEEMTKIFNSLSEDNRAKLLELSRLYLDAQRKNGQNQ